MKTVLEKLNEELNRILYERKKESNKIITESEITSVFEMLKKEDMELKPVLEAIEKLLKLIPDEQYMLKEETIIQILKYYNLIQNDNMIEMRHKLFFTEERKMVKKPYFTSESSQKVKERIKSVFTKI